MKEELKELLAKEKDKMPTSYSNSRVLLDFINSDDVELEIFLFGGDEFVLPTQSNGLSQDEFRHEMSHAEVWSWIGVSVSFHRDGEGFPFTVPNHSELEIYIIETQMTKEQFLNFYTLVVAAPRDLEGMDLRGTDLRDYKILTRQIRTREDLALYEAGQY